MSQISWKWLSIILLALHTLAAGAQQVTLPLVSERSAPIIGVTDAKGTFTFVSLPAGRYGIHAELEGFSSIEYELHLVAGQTTSIEVRMSAAVEDVITVTDGAVPLLDWRKRRAGPKTPDFYDFDAFKEEASNLKQGLVGGVKPLDVAIPETGKLLLLTAVLPPGQVGVELEVKAKR